MGAPLPGINGQCQLAESLQAVRQLHATGRHHARRVCMQACGCACPVRVQVEQAAVEREGDDSGRARLTEALVELLTSKQVLSHIAAAGLPF